MNWEAVGALAEMFGAIGVITTLGFLARQINQNTNAVRASTNDDQTRQRNDLNLKFGLDPVAAELFLRGSQNLQDLEFNDRYRYGLLMRAVIGICEDTFVQYSEGEPPRLFRRLLGCPDFDGGRKLDFAAIILTGGRDGTKGLPAGVSATRSGAS